MSWLQLELETNQVFGEELSVLLEEFGAISISLTASSDEPIFDEDAENNTLWDKTKLTALLNSKCDVDSLLIKLHKNLGSEAIHSHKIKFLKDKDWIHEFKSKYQPIFFLNKICISPSWCNPESEIPTIILDPGLAFGTGTHPTTSLCIEWLCQNDLNDKIIIDYGCGSGILAMVAAKLGAKQVFAIDIDEQALSTALNKLLKEFSSLTKSGSDIILSGLLAEQVEECLVVYKRHFNMHKPVLRESWASLHGTRH